MPRRSSGVRLNACGWVFMICAGTVAIYLIYLFWPSRGGYHIHHHETWNPDRKVLPIPQWVLGKQPNMIVQQKQVHFTSEGKQVEIFYLEAQPETEKNSLPSVVLLHGMGDSSANWDKIQTLHFGAALGFRTIAIDLPEHGKSVAVKSPTQRGQFLEEFLKASQAERPVIVAASMGGTYAIPYIMDPRANTCDRRARGFISIASVGTNMYKNSQYKQCHIPSMIVFGVNDTHLGLLSVGDLRNMGNNEIFPIEKAGHACHHERPAEWHKLLYTFLKPFKKHLHVD